MEYTENLNLKKPLPDEPYDIGDFNGNFDSIDQAMTGIIEKEPITNQTLTIPTAGWIPAAVGQYSYSITLPVSGITAQDIPSGSIIIETEHIAQDCNLAAQCQSGEGIITFYAESVPEAEMTYEYYILKGE